MQQLPSHFDGVGFTKIQPQENQAQEETPSQADLDAITIRRALQKGFRTGRVFQPIQTFPDQAYIDSTVTAIETAIQECLNWWLQNKPDLDLEKAGPIVSRALKLRGTKTSASIREGAQYVMGRIYRKELDKLV